MRPQLGGLYLWNGLQFYGTDSMAEIAERGNSTGLAYGTEFDFSIHVSREVFAQSGFPKAGDSITDVATGFEYPIGSVDHTPNSTEVILRIANVSR